MSSGCFSWCPLLLPRKSKFTETVSEVRINSGHGCANSLTTWTKCVQKLLENELAIVPATRETSLTNPKAVRGMIHCPAISLTRILIQKLSENPREVVPSTTKYITATGKQTLMLLQSAATLIPVPAIKEVIGVALKIIEICEVRKIPPRKGCEIVLKTLLSAYICRREKG